MRAACARAGAALALGVTLVATAPVRAQTASETAFFDALARQGYAAGRYAAALDDFLHVHALTPSAGAAYNVALCAELAGQPALAFAFFGRYLELGDGDAERNADAERRLGALRGRLALVEVRSDPPGARLVVDREELGVYGAAPRTLALDPGPHRVLATLDGFHSDAADVAAVRGATAEVTLKLTPIRGELRIARRPVTGTLTASRDGRPVTLPAREGPVRVQVGRYELELSAPGHRPARASVVVTEDGVAEAALVAEPIPPPTGTLLVDTGHDTAELSLDGKPTGLTPLTLRRVPVGSHRLRVAARGRTQWEATVEVREGAPTYVNVTLTDAEAR